jgi:cytochrome c-type biogenesis protein CcmH/NrfF
MKILWLVPMAILLVAGGALLRARRRKGSPEIAQTPVSGQWLAEARGREDHHL